jgi:hypothetical protein
VRQWTTSLDCPEAWGPKDQWIASKAAQWGADQELEAVEEEIITQGWFANSSHRRAQLRAARRPKSRTLAEQTTAELDDAVMRGDCITTTDAMPLLRAALKRLTELEALPNE